MKINNKNEIYHEMGIKYLCNLFKFIRINSKLKITNIIQKNNKKSKDSEQGNEGEENIDMEENQNEENENDEDEDIEEEDEMLSESDSFEDEEDEDNWEEIDNNSFIEDDDEDSQEEEEEENNNNANIEGPNDSNLFNINEENDEEINNNENNNNNNNNEENNENNNQSQNPNQNNLEDLINIFSGLSNSYVNNNIINNNNNNFEPNDNENENENEQEEEDIEYDEMEEDENDNDNEDDEDEDSMNIIRNNNNNRIEIIENDSHSESNENIRRRQRFNPFRRRANEIEIVQRNNYQNDDYTLFYNPSLNNNGSNTLKSELELYFEESVTFPFKILKHLENNSLILFYRTKMCIKIITKKNVEIVEKMGNLFLYNYIYPFDNNFKRYFFFALIGAKEGALSHYFKEIEKIKDNYNSICLFSNNYDKKLKTERTNIIKQIKTSILENNPNIIKLDKKEEKEKINEDKDKKEKQKDDKIKDNEKRKKKKVMIKK